MTVDLRAIRMSRGLTLRAAAIEAGVNMHALQRVEHGSTPYPENAKKIAEFYEVEMTELLDPERTAA
jgi:transcriptional regulator with XRE-family HTH domain